MKALIATPAYGGTVFTGYHESVLRTVLYFRDEFPGIHFNSKLISISVLTVARNIFASLVLNDSSYTHLLFIDADMVFTPNLIAKMLAFRKPVVGIVAPAKRLDYEALHRARLACGNDVTARLIANEYIGGGGAIIRTKRADGLQEIEIVDGFVRVHYAGAGILLIAREVLETIRQRFPELWIANPPQRIRSAGLVQGGLLQCFEPMADSDGIPVGEDISFCKRWVEGCGGEVWSSVDEGIGHIGQEAYVGQYLTRMKQDPALKLTVMTSPVANS